MPTTVSVSHFTVEPTTIIRGQSVTLRWEVTGDVNRISIDHALGDMQRTGSIKVFPTSSTTYTLSAAGTGGGVTAVAVVTVGLPPPPIQAERSDAELQPGLEERLSGKLQDVYFDYGRSDLRDADVELLRKHADALKAIMTDFPEAVVVIEGHCDDRGSAEYNLGLGDWRAEATRDVLVKFGVPNDRLRIISYGKERPLCAESNESCWQKGRRTHLAAANLAAR